MQRISSISFLGNIWLRQWPPFTILLGFLQASTNRLVIGHNFRNIARSDSFVCLGEWGSGGEDSPSGQCVQYAWNDDSTKNYGRVVWREDRTGGSQNMDHCHNWRSHCVDGEQVRQAGRGGNVVWDRCNVLYSPHLGGPQGMRPWQASPSECRLSRSSNWISTNLPCLCLPQRERHEVLSEMEETRERRSENTLLADSKRNSTRYCLRIYLAVGLRYKYLFFTVGLRSEISI